LAASASGPGIGSILDSESVPSYTDASRYRPDQEPEGERRGLLARVPDGAEVLDVGCWSGFNGRHLMMHRSVVVDGIEPVAEMAHIAARGYRTVHTTTVEAALDGPLAEGGRYDVVLMLDVLEHLVDPEVVLRRLRDVVRPGGTGLVSLPNVAHWSVRKELALGRFTYASSGLLDATHLRFFTMRSGAELLVLAGWEILWSSVALDRPPIVPLHGRWLRALRRWPGLFAVQMLFEIRPAA